MRYDYRDIRTQNVEVRGFCNMRIDEAKISDRKFPYVVAGDDDSGGDPARIKEHILVKFFETYICGRGLSLKDEGALWK